MTKITVFVFILLSLTNCANTLDSNIKSCIKNGKCSTQIHEEKGYEIVVNKDKEIIASRYNHFNNKGLSNKVGHFMLDVLPRLFRENYDYYHDQGSLSTGDLVRIDVSDPFDRNLRLPDPASGNKYHKPNSGLTLGGRNEAVIDAPSRNDPLINKR